MNIKDFLIENYVYIIIVIVLTIVTIIGFLADKKKNGDKKPKTIGGKIETPKEEPSTEVNQEPLNYQPMDSTMVNSVQPQMAGNVMPTMQPVQENIQINPQNVQPVVPVTPMAPVADNNSTVALMDNQIPVNNVLNTNVPQPVEQMPQATNIVTEPMYQPQVEQNVNVVTPNIMPQTTFSIPSVMPQNGLAMQPNIMAQSVQQPVQPQVVETPQPVLPTMLNQPEVLNPMPMPQPTKMEQPVQPNMAFQTNIPSQMPINAQPMPMPNQGENTIPNPITPPQPVTPQPISFVYGQGSQTQGNNNQFMQ